MGPSMTRPWAIALALAVLGLMAAQALGYTITIDGNVGDWGIAPRDYWHSDWDPLPGICVNIGGSSEDYRPCSGGYVGPGWGGQRCDAEALYYTADDEYAYFLVVTGVPPDARCDGTPGDIAIDLNRDGTWDLGLETTGNNGNVLGGLYGDVEWHAATLFPSSSPAYIEDGILAWDPDFDNLFYSSIGYDHYVIEAGIPLEVLPLSAGETTPFRAHWTMRCGNDEVNLECEFPPYSPQPPLIPEPGTSTMLCGGVLALAFAGLKARKRRKRAAR